MLWQVAWVLNMPPIARTLHGLHKRNYFVFSVMISGHPGTIWTYGLRFRYLTPCFERLDFTSLPSRTSPAKLTGFFCIKELTASKHKKTPAENCYTLSISKSQCDHPPNSDKVHQNALPLSLGYSTLWLIEGFTITSMVPPMPCEWR